MTALLYIATGAVTVLLVEHRHAVAAAVWRAVDWLCEDPEPSRPVVGARNVRVQRDGRRHPVAEPHPYGEDRSWCRCGRPTVCDDVAFHNWHVDDGSPACRG